MRRKLITMSQQEATIFCALHSCGEFGQKKLSFLTAEHPKAPRNRYQMHPPGVGKQSSLPQNMSPPVRNVSDSSSATCMREKTGKKGTKTKDLLTLDVYEICPHEMKTRRP